MVEDEPNEVAGDSSDPFGSVLGAVIVLMFVCLALWVALATLIADPTASQRTLTEGVSHAFTACLGALLGLFGGKLS